MRKALFFKNYPTNGDPLNLYFTKDSVITRLFSRVDSPRNEEEVEKYEKNKSSALNLSLLIRDEKEYLGKYFLIDNDLYKVDREITVRLPKELWKPNNEVCLAVSGEKGRGGISFFLRKTTMRNGKREFSQLYEKSPSFPSLLLFHWFVMPDSNLLTAPVIAEPSGDLKVITNLELGTPLFSTERRFLTAEQNEEAKIAGRKFKSYWLPSLKIEGPSEIKAGESAEYTLLCVHNNGQMCNEKHEYIVQAISGYAPHTRVTVENGMGKFRMMALGLNKGDVMKIRIDDQNWIGKAEKSVLVN